MRVTEMKLLAGQSEQITMSDLRKRPGDIFTQVQMGKTFTITKAGKVIAVLSRPEPTAVQLGAAVRKLGLAGK